MKNMLFSDFMKKKFKNILFSLFLIFLTANLFVGYSAFSQANKEQPEDNGYNSVYKFMYVIQKIRRDYVDQDKVSYDKLIKSALRGMMRGLDPFCSYMDEKGYQAMIDDTEGREYGGVGLVITYKNNALKVIAPMDDSPGAKAGIKPGDVITKIDDKDTSNMNFDECVKMLKGEPGTEIKLSVYRESDDSTFDVILTREKIEVSTVKGYKMIDDKIGYLRITQFSIPTATKFDEVLAKLKKQDMKALIIDLRGNPGGMLTSAIEISSRFVDSGKLIVSTEGRMKDASVPYYSLRCDKYLDLPICILVDRNSASASEIVAGCLQDYKKAVLIGEKTFGKGSVQTVFPIPDDGGAIRLTTAKYYTPSHRVIHENGIEPTIEIPLTIKELDAIYSQRLAYPGVVKPDGHDTITDVQLQRAIEVLRGICLFDGTVFERR